MSDGKEAKEKLRFRINGRSIVYDGYPSARVKDLIDILAKMGIEDDKLVSTFRENIPESSLTDAQVVETYAEAKRLRREKKSKKGDDGNGLETPSQSGEFASPSAGAGGAAAPAPAAAPEQMQRITLHFKGRQYTYDGLPSKKEAALVQLLLKHIDTTPEDIVKTYRENIADHNKYTDAEILAFADDAKKRKGSKSSGSSGAGSSTSSAPPGESGASPRPAGASQDSQPRSSSSANTQLSAIDEISSMSSQERDSINSFINSVLLSQNPATAVAAATRPVVPVAAATPASDSNATEADGHRASLSSADVPKIAVYCQEEGQTTQRVIYCPKHASFADLASLVEKKFGRKMVLSFYEGDDKIEIDDDDVVQLFFELQQDGRKLRLICSLPESRRKVTEDKLTESAAQQQQAATTSSGAAAAGGAGQKSGSNLVTPPAASSTASNKEFNSSGVISAKEVKSFSGHSAAVYCCSFSPKGDKFCSASRDHSVRVWNIATGAMTVMKGGHNGFVLSCDFSPNGNNVVSSADDTSIKIWNVSTAQKSISLKGHDDKVYCVQYNSTGAYIVSGSCDRTVRVWNADSGAKQVTLKGHDLAVFSCCFSNTDAGRFVASGSDDRLVKVWDWREGREVKNLIGHTGTVWSVKFSHHDKYIVSASMDHELKLWDVAAAACIRTMTGHMTPIHHAIFTPNDRYILSCARDWTVMVWDTETGKHVDTIQSHRNTVYHLDMLGEQVLTSSLDDTVKLWTFQELTKQGS